MPTPTLDTLIPALAAALGADWWGVPTPETPWTATLVRADGLALWCRLDHGRLRLLPDAVTGVDDLGRPCRYHFDRPAITVDPARPVARLAADIRRRLLPAAAAWLRDALAWAEQSRDRWEAAERSRTALLALPGAHTVHDPAWIYGDGWRCDARYADRVRLEFSGVPFTAALAALHGYAAARCGAEEAPAAD